MTDQPHGFTLFSVLDGFLDAPDEELSLEESQATGDSPAKPDDPEANK